MLVFDQLKKNDPQLRLLTIAMLAGIFILAAGLWWVQIVSAQDYQQHLETQAFRSVRIPSMRGKILDRNGVSLAENRPTYNVSLFLEELRKPFDEAYAARFSQIRSNLLTQLHETEKRLNRKLTASEKKQFTLNLAQKNSIRREARYAVVSNAVQQISQHLQQPLTIEAADFERHYETRLALPYPVVSNLDPTNIARFLEQDAGSVGVDLEVQSSRVYPFNSTAAHVLGFLRRDDSSMEGEESFFSYRLPDYRGVIGIEAGYDTQLRGHAGAKSVLVNNLGYRQTENVWTSAEPGHNVVLTIDSRIQAAAEKALPVFGDKTRGAAVVMDVRTGDILALASVPTFNPEEFIPSISAAEYGKIQEVGAEKNRATRENYRPGSIFKTVVAMACLENGLNPNANYEVQANPRDPAHGIVYVGRRAIRDTAPPGTYNFRRALIHSSNSYFITNGVHAGVEKIVQLGHRLHLGERIGLPTRQETTGSFPTEKQIRSGWNDGDTANLCIGQGFIDVTPLQMAVVASALANGGKVLWPRLIERIEPQDPLSSEKPTLFPGGQVRDNLGVKPSTLRTLQEAMLDDTESAEGTAYQAFHGSPLQTLMRVCGKTGTAQNEINGAITHTTWFLSFAPYENPRYAVVVMVENGSSGGGTCAPIARQIYEAILKTQQTQPGVTVAEIMR
jgi:penicillin-binding protein 2